MTAPYERENTRPGRVLGFVILMGLVSLWADMTYESARSIGGPYLLGLGATAAAASLIGGVGEFLGYGLRLFFGHLADRWGQYWLLTGVGYAVNLLAVPALALAPNWNAAAGLMVVERIGKAVRTPARDAVLAMATQHGGRGLGFGIHEFLDQVGATAGPLWVAALLARGYGYREVLALLGIPALAALATLLAAWRCFPEADAPAPAPGSRAGGKEPGGPEEGSARPRIGAYMVFASLSTAALAHFQLIGYHAKASGLLADPAIPAAFALAMGVDAATALAAGWLYDRAGLAAVAALPVLAALSTILAFTGSAAGVWWGIALWGAALGMQESVARAAAADLAPAQRQGTVFGSLHTASAAAWLVGSAVMGLLYPLGSGWVAAWALGLGALAVGTWALYLRAPARR